MMKSEITEENDEEICWFTGAQREKIRYIIEHQKSLYWSSSSSLSSSSASCSSSSVIKPILLWGSDADDEQAYDPWESINQIGRPRFDPSNEGLSNFASDGSSFRKEEPGNMKNRVYNMHSTCLLT